MLRQPFLVRPCFYQLTTTTTSSDHNCVRKAFVHTHNDDNVVDFLHEEVDGNKIPHMGYGICVGQHASMQRTYSLQDVHEFGALVQDFNPLHSPQVFVVNKDDGLVGDCLSATVIGKSHVDAGLIRMVDDEFTTSKPVVHGMLISSIFSSIFASLAPGCVYMNQTLDFVVPVHAGDTITGHVKIERIRKWRKGGVVVQCRTEAHKDVGGNTRKEGNDENSPVVALKGKRERVATTWI